MRVLALVGALLFFSVPALCAAEAAVLVTDEVQLRVADAFMEEKEYYRAITEYKRFLFLFPDSTECDYALLQTGIAYLSGGDNDGAVRNLEALRERHPDSPRGDAAPSLPVWRTGRPRELRNPAAPFLPLQESIPIRPTPRSPPSGPYGTG